ncbi:MAG: RlmE family RNA methyltransferase [Rhodospirillales bacterium]|jgi:23S rRNA (uridine2552-2'-O)-methyltransferase|nr:RlmE family RNA methyltransferase [Rhodospirillales bacterium]
MTTNKKGPRGGNTRMSGRNLATRVRTARGRKTSSTRWLQRQLNDPYVAEAKKRGYRSRAAFKLLELDQKFHFLKPGMRIVDLGAAPGGWTQVAMERVGNKGRVVALDINEMEPVTGAEVFHCDFLDDAAPGLITGALDGPADVVLSDMAAPITGHPKTDHLRLMGLLEVALDFAASVLVPGGVFVAKVFQGGSERDLLNRMKRDFATVRHAKPPSSRKESSETYVVAVGFRGQPDEKEPQD